MVSIMNRHGSALRGMTALLLAGALSGCRSKPPVVRQFLTMPAEFAGGLSSIERAKWMRSARRQLPSRKTLVTTGHLVLPAYASELGTRISGMEVLRVPGTAEGTAGLAVMTAGHSSPALLRSEPGRFIKDGTSAPPAAAWHFDHENRTVTGTTVTGTPVVQCRWDGTSWEVRRAR